MNKGNLVFAFAFGMGAFFFPFMAVVVAALVFLGVSAIGVWGTGLVALVYYALSVIAYAGALA